MLVAFVIVWRLGKLIKKTTWHAGHFGTSWNSWDSFQRVLHCWMERINMLTWLILIRQYFEQCFVSDQIRINLPNNAHTWSTREGFWSESQGDRHQPIKTSVTNNAFPWSLAPVELESLFSASKYKTRFNIFQQITDPPFTIWVVILVERAVVILRVPLMDECLCHENTMAVFSIEGWHIVRRTVQMLPEARKIQRRGLVAISGAKNMYAIISHIRQPCSPNTRWK